VNVVGYILGAYGLAFVGLVIIGLVSRHLDRYDRRPVLLPNEDPISREARIGCEVIEDWLSTR
jgi:hypothetical protein